MFQICIMFFLKFYNCLMRLQECRNPEISQSEFCFLFARLCNWYCVVPALHWANSSVFELGSSILHYGRFVQCLVFVLVADDD
jgi:hypothetical protein